MSNAELKLKLVKLISDFENRDLLEEVLELLSNADSNSDTSPWNGLTDAHWARLESSIQDYQAGRTLSHEQVKANMDQWLTE